MRVSRVVVAVLGLLAVTGVWIASKAFAGSSGQSFPVLAIAAVNQDLEPRGAIFQQTNASPITSENQAVDAAIGALPISVSDPSNHVVGAVFGRFSDHYLFSAGVNAWFVKFSVDIPQTASHPALRDGQSGGITFSGTTTAMEVVVQDSNDRPLITYDSGKWQTSVFCPSNGAPCVTESVP